MESLQSQKMVVHWDHEPQICKLLEINETILRFMESPPDLPITLWDLEPGRAAVLRGPDARHRVPTKIMKRSFAAAHSFPLSVGGPFRILSPA